MRIRINGGFDIPIGGAASTIVTAAPPVSRVALVGADYGELWPLLAVTKGDRVCAGELLFRNRKNTDLHFTAPASGVVSDIRLGRGGRLTALVIETNDDPPREWEPVDDAVLAGYSAAKIRARLLESGLWTGLRARPYERIATPEVSPRALFITAMDTNPLAPDPLVIVAQYPEAFQVGLMLVSRLTSGPTYVCTAPAARIQLPELSQVSQIEFAGPHPAGLPGTHMHALEHRVSNIPDLWHIGYQDVIAIGRLFRDGRVPTHKIVAIGGPGSLEPSLVRVPYGADMSELVKAAVAPSCRVLSGSILAGYQTPAFLGRYHNQITVLPEYATDETRRSTVARALRHGPFGEGVNCAEQYGVSGGMLPLESFDRVWPYATPPAALLRALLIGNTEEALRLGCRGLAEEDLALCTYVCTAKADYGVALQRVLRNAERVS